MSNFVHTPYVPTEPVTLAIIDYRTPQPIKDTLENKYNIKLIPTPRCEDLYPAIDGHGDIVIYHCGGNKVICAPQAYQYFYNQLTPHGFEVLQGKTILMRNYPMDIAYNVGRVGSFAFHSFRYCDPLIIEDLKEKNVNFIDVKQGYSKCSIAVVGDKKIITCDKMIHQKAIDVGISSLLISPGYIELEGLNYGFIGGCSGLISKDVIFFTGNIYNHPDIDEIDNFFKKHNVEYFCEKNIKLYDIGTLIPLKQK